MRSGLATSGRTHITGRMRWRNLMVAVLFKSSVADGLSVLSPERKGKGERRGEERREGGEKREVGER